MTALVHPAAPQATAPSRPRRVVVGRRVAVAALLVGSVLNAVESIVVRRYLDPDGSPAERAAAIDEHTVVLGLALTAGIVAIPLMVLAFQAMAHLVRARAPRTAAVGSALTFVGAFGFLGIHIPNVVELSAVQEGVDPATTDAVLSTVESSPLGALIVVSFLVGLFFGLATLCVGMWRTRCVPRWVPLSFGLFLVLDFALNGSTGGIDPHPLWVAGCVGVALAVLRTSDDAWENG